MKRIWADRQTRIFAGVALLLVLVLLVLRDNFYLDTLTLTLLFAGLGLAWNIAGGYAGQFSLGHAAFFGVGAYTTVLFGLRLHVSPWPAMLVGGLLAAVLSAGLAALALRLKGPFFSLVTIAFGEVMSILAVNWKSVTRGSEGLILSPPAGGWWLNFSDKGWYAAVALGFMVVAFLVSILIEHSRFGYYLRAIGEDDAAAGALGVNVRLEKIKATMISAFLTALGGAFYAYYIQYIDPSSTLHLDLSIQMAMIAIIGGLGRALGPVAGAFLLMPLGQAVRGWLGGSLQGLHLFVYGALLVVVVITLPRGIISALMDRRPRRRKGVPV